jgi:hypothetical protein
MSDIPEKIILRNAIIKIDDLLYIGAMLFLLYFSIKDITSIWTIIMLGLFLFWIYNFIKRLKNRKPQIIIDKRGIELCEDKDFYKWSEIKFAFIKAHTTGYGDTSTSEDYFHIVTSKIEIERQINDFKYSSSLVKKAIEFYSGRNNADYNEMLRDKVNFILKGNNFSKEVMELFSRYRKRQYVITFVLFFGIIGTSVYYQIITNFHYWIGVGFALCISMLFGVGEIEEVRFRRKQYICDLTDEQYDKIAISQQLKYPKKQMIGYAIFFAVITIVIFVISYLFAKK